MKGWLREASRTLRQAPDGLNPMIQYERLISKQTELAKKSSSPNISKP